MDGEALRGVDLDLTPGIVTALVGRSGSGKSTLVGCLAGLLAPTAGSVLMDGRRPPSPGDVGLVLQNPEHQIVASTVARELAFTLEARAVSRPEMAERVAAMAARLRLGDRLDSSPRALSAGERQRLACGGVLIARPRHLVLDEATSLLDPPSRSDLRALVREEADSGTAVLFVTQFPEEARWADRVLALETGSIVSHGWPDETATAAGRLSPWSCAGGAGESNGRSAVALRFENVTLGREGETRRLRDVSFGVSRGEAVVVTGPSGSGKTTLLLAAAGALRPATGRIARPTGAAGRIALALQFPERQFSRATAREEFRGDPGLADALRLCARLGLPGDVLGRSPFRLSTGEQRRLAVAVALARRPVLALLDEPTAGLDPDAAALLLSLLEEERAGGLALVVATHDPAVVAALGGRPIALEAGRIVPAAIVLVQDASAGPEAPAQLSESHDPA